MSAATDRCRVALANLKRVLQQQRNQCCNREMQTLRTGYLTCIKCGRSQRTESPPQPHSDPTARPLATSAPGTGRRKSL